MADAGLQDRTGAEETNSSHACARAASALDVVLATIHQLPPPRRLVITMRDVQGCDPEEVCDALDITEGNQRVLLHRARSKVRSALESHLGGWARAHQLPGGRRARHPHRGGVRFETHMAGWKGAIAGDMCEAG